MDFIALSQMLIKIKPYLAMISLQFGYAGMYIITVLSFKSGMSHWVLVVYRHLVAAIAIAPFAFVLERKIRPKLTLSVFVKVLLLALLEPVIDQNLYYVGMTYTSATFTSAMVNVLPALTFVMALTFRMEKVKLKQKHGLAKVIGTVITLSGAMLMTLYKGPIVNIFGSHGSDLHGSTTTSAGAQQHWVAGTIMLLSSVLGWSAFFIVQSFTLKEYPAALSLTALICVMGTVEGGIVALIMERNNTSAWIVGFDSRLFAAVYSGVVCSGIAYYVQGFVNKMRGPVFVTAFSPLSMIITAILGAIVLGELLHLGTLIGAIIVVTGLYAVVWGKSKDQNSITEKGKLQELPEIWDDVSNSTTGNFVDIIDGRPPKSKAATKNMQPEEPRRRRRRR